MLTESSVGRECFKDDLTLIPIRDDGFVCRVDLQAVFAVEAFHSKVISKTRAIVPQGWDGLE